MDRQSARSRALAARARRAGGACLGAVARRAATVTNGAGRACAHRSGCAADHGRASRLRVRARNPRDARAQARYCAYASLALAQVPDARALVVWDEANSHTYWGGTPSEYEALLARCYDTLHRPGLTILDSTASGHAPEAFLRAVGAAYRASGRARPLVDAFGHNPYPADWSESPSAVHRPGFVGEGDYARLVRVLHAAFGRTPKIWYLEDGFQSAVPAPLSSHYYGRENVRTLTPAQQARDLEQAIRLAACQPDVHAFFNFELADEQQLAGWQSGLIWRGVHRKPAAAAYKAAARQAASGCP
jgi:hypothetical protein